MATLPVVEQGGGEQDSAASKHHEPPANKGIHLLTMLRRTGPGTRRVTSCASSGKHAGASSSSSCRLPPYWDASQQTGTIFSLIITLLVVSFIPGAIDRKARLKLLGKLLRLHSLRLYYISMALLHLHMLSAATSQHTTYSDNNLGFRRDDPSWLGSFFQLQPFDGIDVHNMLSACPCR